MKCHMEFIEFFAENCSLNSSSICASLFYYRLFKIIFFHYFQTYCFFYKSFLPTTLPSCKTNTGYCSALSMVYMHFLPYHTRESSFSVSWNIHTTLTRLKAFTIPILTASIGNRSDLSDRPASGDEELWTYDNRTLITKLVTVVHSTSLWRTLLDSKKRSSTWSIIHLYALILRG